MILFHKFLLVSAGIIFAFLLNGYIFTNTAKAADARNFNAGRIIDDSVFTNSNSMSVQDIQNFLNSKMPNCDTYGTGPSAAGGTNRQWLESRGYSPPYKCVKDYRENPSNGENNYGKSTNPAGSLSSAELIYNYSRQFNINPQVLIVTLQKENGMITDNIPIPKQYSEAMGFGCPDTTAPGAPACDPAYGSFSTQLYQAARHFRGYLNNTPGWWIPFTVGWNSIELKPHTTCGTNEVYIENRSTVALYSYTPYIPNQAAKNAQYGLGDGCSSYGNRNFYLYFTDWFGSTSSVVSITSPLRVSGGVSGGYFTRVPTTVSFDVTNISGYPINIGSMAVAVRSGQGGNYDYGLKPITVPAHSTVKYESSQVFDVEGAYTFTIVNYKDGAWSDAYPGSNISSNARIINAPIVAMPTLTSSLSTSEDLRVGKADSVTFTIKNNSNQQLSVGKIASAIRGSLGENFDVASDNPTLSSGQSYTYTKSFTPTKEGVHTFSIAATRDNGLTWQSNYPLPENTSIKNSIQRVVKPSHSITSSVQSSLATVRSGQATQLSYKVKNYSDSSIDLGKIGLMGRDPQGRNVDPGIIPVVLAAGEEKVISFNFTPTMAGEYRFAIIQTKNNGATWTDGPSVEAGNLKAINLFAKESLTVTRGTSSSIVSAHVGQSNVLSYKVKNYSDSSIDLGKIGLMGRDPQGRNVDPGIIPVVLAAGEEKVISFNFTPTMAGEYRFAIIQTKNNGATWTDGPSVEADGVNKSYSMTSRPSATIIGSVSTSDFIVNTHQATQLSYKVKNYSDSSIDLGKIGLMGRDPQGRNVDPGIIPVVLAAGEEKVISFNFTPTMAGEYRFATLGTVDNGKTWNSGPAVESSLQFGELRFIVK